MQPNAEHQQNDPKLRELGGQFLVGDIAGGERSHHHAGEQIAHQRREFQAMGECAEHEGHSEAGDKGRD